MSHIVGSQQEWYQGQGLPVKAKESVQQNQKQVQQRCARKLYPTCLRTSTRDLLLTTRGLPVRLCKLLTKDGRKLVKARCAQRLHAGVVVRPRVWQNVIFTVDKVPADQSEQ